MKKNRAHPQGDVTTLPIIPGTLVIAGGVLIAFVLLMAMLYHSGILTPPAFLDGLFSSGDAVDPGDGFSEEFLSSLDGNNPLAGDSAVLMDMSQESLKELLLAAEPTHSYYQIASVTWADANDRFTTAQVYYLVSGTKIHAESFTSSTLPKQLTADEDTFYIREGTTSRHFIRSGSTTFTPEGEMGLPSLSRMQSMIGAAESGKYTLSLETILNTPCIRASFTDTVSGVRETFDVIPDYGIIVAAYSYLPDASAPYYMMQTSSVLTDISGFDESIFSIPNS